MFKKIWALLAGSPEIAPSKGSIRFGEKTRIPLSPETAKAIEKTLEKHEPEVEDKEMLEAMKEQAFGNMLIQPGEKKGEDDGKEKKEVAA